MKSSASSHTAFNAQYFNDKGLNIQAVFNIETLPDQIKDSLYVSNPEFKSAKQLIVIGHAGRLLWDKIKSTIDDVNDPIDQYSIAVVEGYFKQYHPGCEFYIIYPKEQSIGLQQIGELAGWHYASPFRIGINNLWGSWFAYRAVVLADTVFDETKKLDTYSPCINCNDKVCLSACPAGALFDDDMSLTMCINYRKQEASNCKVTCLARYACPAGQSHQYVDEQMQYHYGISMKMIEALY